MIVTKKYPEMFDRNELTFGKQLLHKFITRWFVLSLQHSYKLKNDTFSISKCQLGQTHDTKIYFVWIISVFFLLIFRLIPV